MTIKVINWISDDHAALVEAKAGELGLKPHEVSTLLLLSWAGVDLPKKSKGKRKWIAAYGEKTRAEYKDKGTQTIRRVINMLEQAEGEPMSTPDLLAKLGWKRTGSLIEQLNECSRIEQCDTPAAYSKKRGRQPRWWKLVES